MSDEKVFGTDVKVVDWKNKVLTLQRFQDDVFVELQDMCIQHGDGLRWFSIPSMLRGLVDSDYYSLAMGLVSDYYHLQGEIDMLQEYVLTAGIYRIQ